jgi:hypothetical protein
LRWILPSLSDCLFLAVLVWLFATGSGGWVGLLADGDSGWHIRTGEWILEHGTVPKVDLFSFSKAGQPWFAWEWLTDILYATLHAAAGLKGLVLLSGLLIAGFGTLLFRHMIWRGATPFAALVTSLLVFGASSIHFLARPHVFTLLGLTVAAWMIDADRREPSRRIWLLVPLTAIWVNLHGGFLGLIACLGLLFAGTALESTVVHLTGGRGQWESVRRYGLLLCLCGAASFVNPYGYRLHAHILAYLRSDWIKNNVQEFQSPVFRSENMLQFEIMLFAGVMTVLYLVSRREFVGALWILFWGHSALTSARHVPIYMILAAPFVAQALTVLWSRYVEPAPRTSFRGIFASLARDITPNCRRSSVWVPVAALLLCLAPEPLVRWPKDYPELKFPVNMVAKHGPKLVAGRTLMPDQWADYAIYRQYPAQKVYVDGRSDFFGKEIGDEYLKMMQGQWEWESLLARNRFDYVLCPLEWPLGSLLKQSRAWTLLEDDGQALLFQRLPERGDSARHASRRAVGEAKKASSLSNENP